MSDAPEALNALFRENHIPMSDRNGVLYDRISAALAALPPAVMSDERKLLAARIRHQRYEIARLRRELEILHAGQSRRGD